VRGIEEAPKAKTVEERGEHLNEYFTYSLCVPPVPLPVYRLARDLPRLRRTLSSMSTWVCASLTPPRAAPSAQLRQHLPLAL
jgi:hypothetical protein